jgi:chromosome segregation ATPase
VIMTDQNLRLANRRAHRGGFFIGAGVLCTVAVTLAGCSGLSKKQDSVATVGQTSQVETERARFTKSERARKAAVQKLATVRATNTALKKQLLDAKDTAKKLRDEAQAADKDIADLEAELAKVNTQPAKTEKSPSALQQSEQLVESLKTRLDKSSNELSVLKAQLDEAQKDSAQVIEKMLAAASREARESKQQIEQLGARIKSVEGEKGELKQKYIRVQQQAAQLDKTAKESRAESEKLNKQMQAVLVKTSSALKERAQVEQAATKEAEALRAQLKTAKQQISDVRAEAKTARTELAAANDEIARLKAVQVKKSTSSATQQPAQPQ